MQGKHLRARHRNLHNSNPLLQAARYFDVEERMVKLTPEHFVLTPEGAEKLCDDNTIGEGLS